MFTPCVRLLTAASSLLIAATAVQAQWFPGSCASCAQPTAVMMPPPVSYAYDPCNVCAQPVAVMQPVTQTVYREVPVTKYRPVQKTVQRPVVKTVYEERPVTQYRTVMEARTVDVPTTTYQTVTECQQMTANRSYWQTTYQPVPKMSPCQYDPNPTLLGWMNRNAYSLRMAFTPNYMRQRQFVPNVVAYNVPVQRTVAVPTTRQVTYNVARLEPYQATQTVAVNKVEYVDTPVTAYEPYTEMQTVAVGTHTTYAFVGPSGTTATAGLQPTPATADTPVRSRTAQNPNAPATPPRGNNTDDLFKPLSHPHSNEAEPTPAAGYFDARVEPQPTDAANSVVRVTGWRPRRNATPETPRLNPSSRQLDDAEVIVAVRQ